MRCVAINFLFIVLKCSITIYLEKTVSKTCKTDGGLSKQFDCVFPFKYAGKTFTECPFDYHEGYHWCSTKVDMDGNFIEGGDFWGYCGIHCPLQGI